MRICGRWFDCAAVALTRCKIQPRPPRYKCSTANGVVAISTKYRFKGMPTPTTYKSDGVFYFSYNVGPAHVIAASTFYPTEANHDYSDTSPMTIWLKKDLAAVDRSVTPWLIVSTHAPWYNRCDEKQQRRCALLLSQRCSQSHAALRRPPLFDSATRNTSSRARTCARPTSPSSLRRRCVARYFRRRNCCRESDALQRDHHSGPVPPDLPRRRRFVRRLTSSSLATCTRTSAASLSTTTRSTPSTASRTSTSATRALRSTRAGRRRRAGAHSTR